jgi:hypothetical protein
VRGQAREEEMSAICGLPSGFEFRRGSCVPAAMVLCRDMVSGRDFVVEGLVRFGSDIREHEHTWVEINGIVYDPTFIQFRRFFRYGSPQYTVVRRIDVGEYRLLSRSALGIGFWRSRLYQFGVIHEAHL